MMDLQNCFQYWTDSLQVGTEENKHFKTLTDGLKKVKHNG